MTKTLALSCLVLSCLLRPSNAEMSPMRFAKEIERADAARECILGVTLDDDVFAATRDGFPDLRILDAKGQETPYLLERATEPRMHTVREGCPSNVASLAERGGGIEVRVRLKHDAPAADGLTIVTPLANYERRVHISGSEDGEHWTPLVADGLIFDYSRYMDVENREIRLPKNRCRQFRIVIDNIVDSRQSPFSELTRKSRDGVEVERTERTTLEQRPMRIDRLDFWRETKEKLGEQDRRADYPTSGLRVEEDRRRKSTVVYVRSRRQPLTELVVETAKGNFNRTAVVEVPTGWSDEKKTEKTWGEIGRARLTRIDFGGFHRQELGIAFPEQRRREYRIVIENADNPPLEIAGVKAAGNVYRAVLLAQAGDRYRMAFGSDEAKQPEYDAAAVLAPLRQGHDLVEAKLGAEQPLPVVAAPPPPFKLSDLLGDIRFLGPAIVLLVVVLGWALVRAVRRINDLPRDQ